MKALPTQTNNSDIAYIAGLFDGEGTVDFAKRLEKRKTKSGATAGPYMCWKIMLRIEMTDEPTVQWVCDTLNLGTVRKRNRSPSVLPHWKDRWVWTARHQEALSVAKLISPLCKVKQPKLKQIIDHYGR